MLIFSHGNHTDQKTTLPRYRLRFSDYPYGIRPHHATCGTVARATIPVHFLVQPDIFHDALVFLQGRNVLSRKTDPRRNQGFGQKAPGSLCLIFIPRRLPRIRRQNEPRRLYDRRLHSRQPARPPYGRRPRK